MAFDLTNLMNEVQQNASEAQGSGDSKDFKYPLYYTGDGTIKVKLLFNPKSQTVARLVRKHKISGTNHCCLQTYGEECPICKSAENILNAVSKDLWTLKNKPVGLSLVQYVGSESYSWGTTKDGKSKEPKVGDIIVLMYPWSVYQKINARLAELGNDIATAITANEGFIFKITKGNINGQISYDVVIPPTNNKYASCNNQDEFDKLLNGLDDLNEIYYPKTCTDEIRNDAKNCAESMEREYLGNMISKVEAPAQTVTQQFTSPQPNSTPVQPNPTPVQSGNNLQNPPCWGTFNTTNANCIKCGVTSACMVETMGRQQGVK